VSSGVTADMGVPGGTQVEGVRSVADNVIWVNLQLIHGSALTQAKPSAKKNCEHTPYLELDITQQACH